MREGSFAMHTELNVDYVLSSLERERNAHMAESRRLRDLAEREPARPRLASRWQAVNERLSLRWSFAAPRRREEAAAA